MKCGQESYKKDYRTQVKDVKEFQHVSRMFLYTIYAYECVCISFKRILRHGVTSNTTLYPLRKFSQEPCITTQEILVRA